jgi:hypothetical protein
MSDRMTNTLLTLIALALWLDLGLGVLRPSVAAAQGDLGQRLLAIEENLAAIASGQCANKKIC